jgi:electron transfer flavoprotein alpha subunit
VILALVEHDDGSLDELSLQVLTAARALARDTDTSLAAVAVGEEGRAVRDAAASYGVSTLHVVEHPRLTAFAPDAWAEGVTQLIRSLAPPAVLAAGSERGNEVLARVAARCDAPLAANCIRVEPGEAYRVTRVRWGGSLLEVAELEGETKLLTVAPHAFAAEEAATAAQTRVDVFEPELPDDAFRVLVVDRVEPEPGKVSLPEARVVVGGGRGLGSAEAFGELEALASLLGGPVGCSRAVTSLGWRPHSDQIGQTGTRIAPELYIACGISGAIQHMVGCKAAKRVLVINTDPQAPILAHADYAVIGDVHAVVPAVTEEIRKRVREPSV